MNGRAATPSRGRAATVATRVAALDWARIGDDLDRCGAAVAPALLGSGECAALTALYDDEARFRSHVVMARHGFGSGDYKYFARPLPDAVASLREALYARLATVANRWSAAIGDSVAYPADLAGWLARCHAAGQTRPTPLLLRYGPGDYNCLHQDRYGAHVFPLQVTVLLSAPGRDFDGGAFVITEQRPRRQSRAEVVDLGQGDAVVFASATRPVIGTRGPYRVTHRHGVSRVHSGCRHALGIIFHDAE